MQIKYLHSLSILSETDYHLTLQSIKTGDIEGEQKLSGLNTFFKGSIGRSYSKVVTYDLEYLILCFLIIFCYLHVLSTPII